MLAVASLITSRIPLLAASDKLCVAISTRQLAFRITLSQSRILCRKTSCPSINHASSSRIAAGCPCNERSIRRKRYNNKGSPYFGAMFISSSISNTLNFARASVSRGASNNCPIDPSMVYSHMTSRIDSS